MQGGGALGAFQAGVYQALHEAGIEPDWVVGTSIGAINAALIAGNKPADRLDRLRKFWDLMASDCATCEQWDIFGMGRAAHNLTTVTKGIPGFFTPNPRAWFGNHTPLGVSDAAYYSTTPLRQTLADLVDFQLVSQGKTRLTLGAVNVGSGQMRYFDSRQEAVALEHVMASGALPPAFPAVIIDGEPYWDGGIYSNTPIEVVMDDNPRRDSLIFSAQLWQQEGEAPQSIDAVISRQKDIQFGSRAESHTTRQQQIHHLRHIVRELGALLPEGLRHTPQTKELLAWGCSTVMHIVPLSAPRLDDEDETKDIDFTPIGIRARWEAGYQQASQQIAAAPWKQPIDPVAGIVVHR